MNTYILTESSTIVGLGHLTRCIAIYESFLKMNIKCTLVLKVDESAKIFLKQFYVNLPYISFDWIKSIFNGFDQDFKSNLIIFDSYNVENDLLNQYQQFASKTSIIDDTNRSNYAVNIIINPNLFGTDINYSNQTIATTYLLGKEFLLLRNEIIDQKPNPIKREIKKVFISFGGGINDLLYKTVNLISSNFDYKFLLPKGLSTDQKLFVKSDNIEILNPFSIQDLIVKYNESDIAILNGGQTLNEFLALQIPCIVVQTAENQQNNINFLKRKECIKFVGQSQISDIENKIIECIIELGNYKVRQNIRNNLKNLFGKKGGLSLAKQLQKIMKESN